MDNDPVKVPKYVFLPGGFPGWDGLFGQVTYGYEGGQWTPPEIYEVCRQATLEVEQAQLRTLDCNVWTCGGYRLMLDRTPAEMDMQQYQKGEPLPSPRQLNLCEFTVDSLQLCESIEGDPRPTGFSSGPRHGLAKYTKVA